MRNDSFNSVPCIFQTLTADHPLLNSSIKHSPYHRVWCQSTAALNSIQIFKLPEIWCNQVFLCAWSLFEARFYCQHPPYLLLQSTFPKQSSQCLLNTGTPKLMYCVYSIQQKRHKLPQSCFYCVYNFNLSTLY